MSWAGVGGRTPNGTRIGPVYTPPSERGHGYASALVAAASQAQLDEGLAFCFLFTDLANPTSNHIYQAIGYEPVTDIDAYASADRSTRLRSASLPPPNRMPSVAARGRDPRALPARSLGGDPAAELEDDDAPSHRSVGWWPDCSWPWPCPAWPSPPRATRRPIDSGDTAWMLMATALVMVMLPGLALFYGGLVRRKNVLSTIMHSFFGLAIVSVVWVLVGFSLAFGPTSTCSASRA